jgi:hypothetical protein
MLSLPSFGSDNDQQAALENDDSIDEMANMLLDDTIDSQKYGADTDLSISIKFAKDLPKCFHATEAGTTGAIKPLPHLPQFLFNGDDAWASKNASVVTAIGRTNTINFTSLESESSNVFSQHPEETKVSPPPIPKRSSKRKSVQTKNKVMIHSQTKVNDDGKDSSSPSGSVTKYSISAPILLDIPRSSSSAPVNHVARIMEANRSHVARKAAEKVQLEKSLVSIKKRRIVDGKVFDMMKTAFNKQIHGKVTKDFDHDLATSLLDYSTNELQGFENNPTAPYLGDEWQPGQPCPELSAKVKSREGLLSLIYHI